MEFAIPLGLVATGSWCESPRGRRPGTAAMPNRTEAFMNSISRAGRLVVGFAALVGLAVPAVAMAQPAAAPLRTINRGDCSQSFILCTEVADSEQVFGHNVYVGHDEPSVLFYSNHAGAGNDNTYFVRLPKDPPVRPREDGSGGTWNFQLHPA